MPWIPACDLNEGLPVMTRKIRQDAYNARGKRKAEPIAPRCIAQSPSHPLPPCIPLLHSAPAPPPPLAVSAMQHPLSRMSDKARSNPRVFLDISQAGKNSQTKSTATRERAQAHSQAGRRVGRERETNGRGGRGIVSTAVCTA